MRLLFLREKKNNCFTKKSTPKWVFKKLRQTELAFMHGVFCLHGVSTANRWRARILDYVLID